MKKKILSILLLAMTAVSIQAQASSLSSQSDEEGSMTADQEVAARHKGVSTIGNILVCEFARQNADGSSSIVGELAVNPHFGIIPNDQKTIQSGLVKATVTVISEDGQQGLMRLDVWTSKENHGADFANKVVRLVPQQFTFNSQSLAEVRLTTDKTKSGATETYKLSCRGSRGSPTPDR